VSGRPGLRLVNGDQEEEKKLLIELQRRMQVVVPDADSCGKGKPAVEQLFKTSGRSRPGRKYWPSRERT
jgi:hypothetical protein